MRILLTSVGKRVQLVKHLQEDNHIIGIDMSDLAPARCFVDSFYLVDAYDTVGYTNRLIEICRREKVDMVIPLYEKEFFILDARREDFKEIGTLLLLSHREIIEACDDKLLTYKFMRANGIDVPKSLVLADLYDREEGKIIDEEVVREQLSFPLITKPRQGMGSQGVVRLGSYEDLLSFFSSVEFGDLDRYLIQEVCPGVEFTVDVLCDLSGNILSIVPRQRLEVRAGEVVKARSVQNDLIINKTRELVEKLNKEDNIKAIGPLNIQCFLDGDNLQFIEINPRFGGGVPLSFASGVSYSKLLQDMVRQRNLEKYNEIDDGQKGHLLNFNETTMLRYDEAVFIKVKDEGDGYRVDGPISRPELSSVKKGEFDKKIYKTGSEIQALIFDLDDTLYREWDFVFSGFKQVAEFLADKYELDQTEIYDDMLEIFHRNGRGEIFDYICIKYGIDTDTQQLIDIYRNHNPGIKLYDDARILLEKIKGLYKLGIITDGKSSVQWKKVEALGIQDVFDKIIVTDDQGADYWKPSPGPYQDILKALDLSANQAIYIGDNPHKDFITAKKLGIHTVRVLREVGDHMRTLLDEKHEADYLIRDLSKLEEIMTLIKYKSNY